MAKYKVLEISLTIPAFATMVDVWVWGYKINKIMWDFLISEDLFIDFYEIIENVKEKRV